MSIRASVQRDNRTYHDSHLVRCPRCGHPHRGCGTPLRFADTVKLTVEGHRTVRSALRPAEKQPRMKFGYMDGCAGSECQPQHRVKEGYAADLFSDWQSLHCGEAMSMIDGITLQECWSSYGEARMRDDEMASRRLDGRVCAEGPRENGMASRTF